MNPSLPRGSRTLLVVALCGAVYLGYGPALDGELQFDDVHSIVESAGIKDLGYFARAGLPLIVGTTRALTDLTFALNYRASGLAVRPYHLVNLFVHLATMLALLALALQLLRRVEWPSPFATAFLAAALFGLHPLQTQAVAYVCQRAEALAALFLVAGLLLARRGTVLSVVAALACVLAGWQAKPTIATFPVVFLLCGLAFPSGSRRRLVVTSLPFWALTLAMSSQLLSSTHGSKEVGFGVPQMTASRYLLTQSRVVLRYLRLLVWPAGQNLDYDFTPSTSVFEPRTLVALVAVAAILGAAVWLWRRSAGELRTPVGALARIAAFGIFWFFIQLAPTSSVVPVADVIEEHRVYLAAFGILFPAAAGLALLARRWKPAWAVAAAIAVALALALHQRARVWESALALWSDTAEKSPGRARAHMNLGYALTAVDPARAAAEFRLALQLAPADGTLNRARLQQDLAGALLSMRRFDEAIGILRQLAATGPLTAPLETNLAIAYLESGRVTEARATAEDAVRRFPAHAPAWHTLGQIAFARGDYPGARTAFARAVALDRDSPESLASLAVTEEKVGDRAAACAAWAGYLRLPGASVAGAQERSRALGCDQ